MYHNVGVFQGGLPLRYFMVPTLPGSLESSRRKGSIPARQPDSLYYRSQPPHCGTFFLDLKCAKSIYRPMLSAN
jgi:hypothetical protein